MERLKSQLNDKDEQLTICRSEIQHLEENLEQATAQLHKKQEELEEMTDFLQTTERQVHLQKQELEAQAKLKQTNSRKLEGYEVMIKELKKSLAEAADDLKMQLYQLKERRMQRHVTEDLRKVREGEVCETKNWGKEKNKVVKYYSPTKEKQERL